MNVLHGALETLPTVPAFLLVGALVAYLGRTGRI